MEFKKKEPSKTVICLESTQSDASILLVCFSVNIVFLICLLGYFRTSKNRLKRKLSKWDKGKKQTSTTSSQTSGVTETLQEMHDSFPSDSMQGMSIETINSNGQNATISSSTITTLAEVYTTSQGTSRQEDEENRDRPLPTLSGSHSDYTALETDKEEENQYSDLKAEDRDSAMRTDMRMLQYTK